MILPFSCLKKRKRLAIRTQMKIMPQTKAALKMINRQMHKGYKKLPKKLNLS